MQRIFVVLVLASDNTPGPGVGGWGVLRPTSSALQAKWEGLGPLPFGEGEGWAAPWLSQGQRSGVWGTHQRDVVEALAPGG